MIGDGRSDFCMSTRADYVIAKGALADYCRTRGQPHATFADFDDVTAHLAAWLATAGRAPAKAAARMLASAATARDGNLSSRSTQGGRECSSRIRAFAFPEGASASS